MTVTVLAGKVAVHLPRHSRAEARPPLVEANHGVAFGETPGPVRPQTVDVGKALAWREGKVVFERTPFAAAIAELDRYFPGRIVTLGDVTWASPVTGVVRTDDILAGVRAMAAVEGLSIRETPGDLLLILY